MRTPRPRHGLWPLSTACGRPACSCAHFWGSGMNSLQRRPVGRVLRAAEVGRLRGAEESIASAQADLVQRRAETDKSIEKERQHILRETLSQAKADASRRLATVALAAQ